MESQAGSCALRGWLNAALAVALFVISTAAPPPASAAINAYLYFGSGSTYSVGTGTGEIGDFVWFDGNQNGIQDPTETGFQDVTVNLLDSTAAVIGTATTDSNGNYSFIDLAAGTYQVQFVLPACLFCGFTAQYVGSDVSLDSNANTTTGLTDAIVLTSGEVNSTIDAGICSNDFPTKGGPIGPNHCGTAPEPPVNALIFMAVACLAGLGYARLKEA